MDISNAAYNLAEELEELVKDLDSDVYNEDVPDSNARRMSIKIAANAIKEGSTNNIKWLLNEIIENDDASDSMKKQSKSLLMRIEKLHHQ